MLVYVMVYDLAFDSRQILFYPQTCLFALRKRYEKDRIAGY